MAFKLLKVLAYLAGFGIVGQPSSAEILARVMSRDGVGELTLTREQIVYRVTSPRLVIRFSISDVKEVVRKNDVLYIHVGEHSDKPLAVEVGDVAAADKFVKVFYELRASPAASLAPAGDFHQHLFNPSVINLIGGKPGDDISAEKLIAMMDSAGIKRALVLSMAYTWASASRPAVENEYQHVVEENDWTAAQVAKY